MPLTRKAVTRWTVGGALSLAVIAAVVLAGRRKRIAAPLVVPAPVPEPPPAGSRFRPSRRWIAVSVVVVLAAASGITAVVVTGPDGSACMSEPTMSPDTASVYVSGMPREVLVEDLPAPGTSMALGDLLELEDEPERRHDVSVLGADDLEPSNDLRPADGRRLVSVSLQERNMGQTAIVPQVGNYTWLCDADGTWYQHDAAMTGMLAGTDRLEYRQKVVEKVVFQIRDGARPVRVRTAATGDRSTTVADWELD
ncbi:hypothetical protein [Actinoplanes sp. NPDC020271]|uniref:hypothetical protein n=1 Tax=Actinoplanes sp. NPDC020271 TaxID=3363896 RepID=UPI00378C4AA0